MPGAHVPIEIKLHQKSRVMEISFSDGRSFRLPYEFLRVYSPSAEVRGHGPGQEVLQTGSSAVNAAACVLDCSASLPGPWPRTSAEGGRDHGARAGRLVCGAAGLLRRPQHRDLLLGLSLSPRPEP